jgi:signal transduction histidine kinase
MVAGNAVIGVINVYTAQPYRYSDQDVAILTALANLAAIALENARLHQKVLDVEEQLRHNERLGALGLLAAEVAHEIRNPLTVMKMLFHSLDLQFPATDPRAQDVQVMGQKMDQLNQIVDRVLRFARSAEPTFELVDLNELLADVLLLTRHALTQRGIVLATDFAPGLAKARADRAQIEQAALNLILNAADAMPEGGTLTVASAFSPHNSSLILSFSDTGSGISPEKREQLFAPFLTTKARGTGLGLAIVQKIVEAHNGQIEVTSAPGKGTTFCILLPAN